MSHPQYRPDLLYTKLHPPPVREKRVARTRLLEQLDASLNQKLTLICAPAGYGKTTLLSQWVECLSEPVGWVSLDHSDNDLSQFLRYFLAAIQFVEPKIGELISGSPLPAQLSPDSTIWVDLINGIASIEKKVIIILDDYQEVEARPVHEALEYLIERMPDNLNLILASRADPPLPLSRLRARGQLNELRQNDLRFTDVEVVDFLNNIKELNLSIEDVSALKKHTEGWIAALQMAALSLQKQEGSPTSRSAFIQAFTGSNRFVLDYLVDEVLEQQPSTLLTFLLKTSILERLSGPLCDALLEEKEIIRLGEWDKLQSAGLATASSQTVLEYLEAVNLFIIPLDEERGWYRYHRLFSDLLRKRLMQTSPDILPKLHRRASEWFAQQGLMAPAIDHALAGYDFERAAVLIEENVQATLMRSQVTTFLNWVELLPDEWERNHPTLAFYHAWVLLMSGESLDVVEKCLQSVVQDSPENIGRMAVLRAYIMLFQAELPRAAELCREALKHLSEDDLFLRSIATWILSLARLTDGNIQESKQVLQEVARMGQEIGNPMIAVAALCDQAKLHKRQGRLQQARETLEQTLQLATDSRGERLPIASKLLIELGDLEREWNNLETAEAYLKESIELSAQWSELASFYAYFPLAAVRLAKGEVEAARSAIEAACQIAYRSETIEIDDIVAELQQAHFYIVQDDYDEALRWAEKRRLLPGQPPGPHSETGWGQDYVNAHIRKYELLELARLFIRLERTAEALDILEALLAEASQLGRTDLIIQIQILNALAFEMEGHETQAIAALTEAVSLAEPGGYMRIFIDEGEPIARLLHQAASQGIAVAYIARLLAAWDEPGTVGLDATPPSSVGQPLFESLSERELDVLRLLAAGMSNPEIAEELIIAVSTVNSHCKSIYSKLNVHRRWDAVQRAQELGLI